LKYTLFGYNDKELPHTPAGYIPDSVIYISTDIPVQLGPNVKYLTINNINDYFNIETELDYLCINKPAHLYHKYLIVHKPINILVMNIGLHDNSALSHARHMVLNITGSFININKTLCPLLESILIRRYNSNYNYLIDKSIKIMYEN
jgi:hypothetical protein